MAEANSPLRQWLIRQGFELMGVSGLGGRLPLAVSAFVAIGIMASILKRFADLRTVSYAVLIAASSPLMLFNARQMLGNATSMLTQSLIGATALLAVYGASSKADEKSDLTKTSLWCLGLFLTTSFGIFAEGALLGVLPPLAAVAAVTWVDGSLWVRTTSRARALGAWFVSALAVYVILRVASAVYADAAQYSYWTGGRPIGGDPPTFDAVIELVFHSFAPWSAILVLALGRMFWVVAAEPDTEKRSTETQELPSPLHALRLSLALWAVFAYGALTLYTSRYGQASYGATVALAAIVALFIREAEQNRRAWWTAATVVFLFSTLIIRDYALYPGSPIDGLAIADLEVPEVFNPKRYWAVLVGLFGLTAFFGFGTGASPAAALDPKAPYRFAKEQWSQGGTLRAWVGLIGLLLVGCVVFGILSLVAPSALPLTSIALRVGRALLFAPLALAGAVLGLQIIIYGFSQLGTWRLAPMLTLGAIIGIYVAFGFQPAISAHFSPREVYDTFNELSDADEIGEFRMSGRAASYYAQATPVELENQAQLLSYLRSEDPRWAVIPAGELATVNRAYRRQNGDHLFVADARNARVALVTNRPVEGRENENFLARYVLNEAPERIQFPTSIKFGDKIELLGFDLDLPNDGSVGPGQDFTITWYWKALRRVGGAWKIFLHIDGHGLRLNGDHDPVDERYPVRLWDEGDVIVDVQELTVPAHYRAGDYAILVGFFSGETRIEVVDGPSDGADRARAGTLSIR